MTETREGVSKSCYTNCRRAGAEALPVFEGFPLMQTQVMGRDPGDPAEDRLSHSS